jgi:hypothetical protein
MQKLKDIEAQLHDSPDQQISLTDPDARSMATSGEAPARLAITYKQPSTTNTI